MEDLFMIRYAGKSKGIFDDDNEEDVSKMKRIPKWVYWLSFLLGLILAVIVACFSKIYDRKIDNISFSFFLFLIFFLSFIPFVNSIRELIRYYKIRKKQ